MQPITVTVGPIASTSANSIVASVTPTAGQTLTLTTSPYSQTPIQEVLVTYGIEATARTLTLTGTSLGGQTQTETITVPINGAGGTVASVLDYATVTSIVSGSAFTNAITVGTNGVSTSPWVRLDGWAHAPVGVQINASGTVNWTLQQTFDDPNPPFNVALASMLWMNFPDLGAVNQTGDYQGYSPFTPVFMRISLNSGTGTVVGTFMQSGSVSY